MNADKNKGCCVPVNDAEPAKPEQPAVTQTTQRVFEVTNIPGGQALLGTSQPLIHLDEEGPSRIQEIEPFQMMNTSVTNKLFSEFISDTNYKTDAQRLGWSFVFYDQLPDSFEDTQAAVQTQWWRKVNGACWNRLAGPEAPTELHDDHPVVHVSWNDAKAFAQWAGGRLPSEIEWEHAARGGLGDVLFPWGNKEPNDSDYQPCNIWQGDFPKLNTLADGFAATAPVKSYAPNGYGLYNLCGNVWEWTSGRLKISGRSAESKQHAKHYKGAKLLKGGSYLCHKSYCFRYRIAARTGTTPDTTTTHQGFRLVF
jgi:formylglycine-generating enzyme required for sulfatase activity